MPADSLTAQTRKLIGSRPWNCEFIRARTVLSSTTAVGLERAGNLAAAQIYVDAAVTDVLLDLRIGLERQLRTVVMPHQATPETRRAD